LGREEWIDSSLSPMNLMADQTVTKTDDYTGNIQDKLDTGTSLDMHTNTHTIFYSAIRPFSVR